MPRFEVRPIIGQRLPAMLGRHRAIVPAHWVKIVDTAAPTRKGLAYGSKEAMAECVVDLNKELS